MDIFKIAAIALCGVILSSLSKNYKPHFAIYIVTATVLIIFGYILSQLTSIFDFLLTVYERLSYGQYYFPILLKILAVAYVSDFVAQICKDAGESSIGGKVELAGKVLIFYLAIPVMKSVLDMIESLVGG
ncbi:MAG: stage III sporulation protein AD [Anaerovoracaceae bacterium]|jgi:stage III sporulation protein AD